MRESAYLTGSVRASAARRSHRDSKVGSTQRNVGGNVMRKTLQATTTTRVVDIVCGQMFCLKSVAGSRVEVVFGEVWLTEEGDSRDHFPRAGDEISLGSQRQILIESLGPIASLLISEPVAAPVPRQWLALPDALTPTAATRSLQLAPAVGAA